MTCWRKNKRLLFVAVICLTSCHSSPQAQVDHTQIALGKDSQTVAIKGLDYSVLQELKQDSLSIEAYQQLFPVYRMPADTDMKDYQNAQAGTYNITDSLVVFKPDTAFKKGLTYFARFYGHSTGNTNTTMAQSKANLKGPKFTEATFKF